MSISSLLLSSVLAVAPGDAASASPGSASTAPAERGPQDFELAGVVVMPTLTGPTFGPDVGVTFGRPDVHLRAGMQVVGGPDRRVAADGRRVGEIDKTGTVHLCGARGRRGWRVRLCGGGQLGMVHLRYRGFGDHPGRRAMPWGALTGWGDLAIPLGRRAGLEDDRLGILVRGGAMIPVLGPALVIREPEHGIVRLRLPRSVGGMFGVGLRVSLR